MGAEPTARSSDKLRHTPISGDSFALTGTVDRLDPAFHAYRKDLADVDLAGRVIASHYAEAVERVVTSSAPLQEGASKESGVIRQLEIGEPFRLLDDSVGWAWGYAGREGHVGFVESDALARRS